jgi:hypothetical protein
VFRRRKAVLDVIAGIAFGAMVAADVTILVSLMDVRLQSKVRISAFAASWVATVVAVAAMGGFRPGLLGPIPTPVLAVGALAAGSLVAWLAWPAFRDALLSVPLAALVGINVFRIGGVFFLLLFADGRLPAPFAPSAGWGDIIIGISAVPIAAITASHRNVSRRMVTAWNALAALDLVVAVTLAFMSAPGTPYRVFAEGPGTAVMTTVPWILAATFLVPLYLLTHFTIAARLRSSRRANVARPEAALAQGRTA